MFPLKLANNVTLKVSYRMLSRVACVLQALDLQIFSNEFSNERTQQTLLSRLSWTDSLGQTLKRAPLNVTLNGIEMTFNRPISDLSFANSK